MQKAMNFNDIVIASVKKGDNRIPFCCMSRDDAKNTIKNSKLNEKKWIVIHFFHNIKMRDKTT